MAVIRYKIWRDLWKNKQRSLQVVLIIAIGALSLQVFRVFVSEGLLLACLSWLIAWPLSIPAGRLLMAGLQTIIDNELTYATSQLGPLYWLAIITVLAVFASWLAARGATRSRVRESLAYQ